MSDSGQSSTKACGYECLIATTASRNRSSQKSSSNNGRVNESEISTRQAQRARLPPPLGKTLHAGGARSRQFLRFGRDESGANRKSHQTGDIVDLQSAHQLQAMRLNCLDADLQQIRDLLCILPFCDKLQYFALPKRELLQLGLVVSLASLFADSISAISTRFQAPFRTVTAN
jgi:hypothetical protein